MTLLRTPEERFADLPGYPFGPNYLTGLTAIEDLRIHYVDEGEPDASSTTLCLHGEPTWSYLYRKMIPVFAAAGSRVVAPDFAGFGKSDKPEDDEVYGFHFHREMLLNLVTRLDLRNITLVVQDWGGLLGLTLPMEMPERFKRLIVMNTTLATGEPAGEEFRKWRAYAESNPDMAVGRLLKRACPHLSPPEVAAYDAPFPDARYKAGVRRFPQMVMDKPEMEGADVSRRAARFLKEEWDGKSFMAIGIQDPVLGLPEMTRLHDLIRNCPPPFLVQEAGHFVQEWGEAVAHEALAGFVGSGQ